MKIGGNFIRGVVGISPSLPIPEARCSGGLPQRWHEEAWVDWPPLVLPASPPGRGEFAPAVP